jgi:signal transduction histidine kinase
MSSLENIYAKMSQNSLAATLTHQPCAEAQRLIGREVAHELNNILTIIRGYTDRMMLKHGEHPTLRQELQLIAENAKRAEIVIRNSARLQVTPAVHGMALPAA